MSSGHPALRDLVRPISDKLVHEITLAMRRDVANVDVDERTARLARAMMKNMGAQPTA